MKDFRGKKEQAMMPTFLHLGCSLLDGHSCIINSRSASCEEKIGSCFKHTEHYSSEKILRQYT